jgi:hypothetical protein
MPFGLKNEDMTFQRIFFDIPFIFGYLDDLLVASPTATDHCRHLREALKRLSDNGLVLNTEKCVWGQTQLEFLGHQVSATGVAPLASRIAAVRDFPCPANVQQLQEFLGLLNFYMRFVPATAAVLRPLTDALRSGRSGNQSVGWSVAMLGTFSVAKVALQAATLLSILPPGPLSLWSLTPPRLTWELYCSRGGRWGFIPQTVSG